jgi:hypothetical protein
MDVSDELGFSVAQRFAVDTDIDDDRARLDPVAAHHFGSAHR